MASALRQFPDFHSSVEYERHCGSAKPTGYRHTMSVRHKGGKVRICAVMRKLLRLAYGVMKSVTIFNAEILLAV
ncbi:hypothetical protein [Xenorhabdus sp. SGI240]|uniref:hypothetical protein n=1 Tax=Xenorhabdus sp. SGI240 TaxID=3158262 RepID=UPI0032B7C5C2